MRRAAARERARQVGVDGGALAEDDSAHDAPLGLRQETAERLRQRLAQSVQGSGMAQIEAGKGSEERC